MMNRYCKIQPQNGFASVEETSTDTLVCPKPRRFSILNTTLCDQTFRSLRWYHGCHDDICGTKSGSDPLDIILTNGGGCIEQTCAQVESSPPFFYGSPPSRVANPLIQDDRFGDDKFTPLSPLSLVPVPSGMSSSPSSSARKGGRVRSNFGNNPAVRIEGFDCLDRDRRNCSIPALA